MGLVHPVNISQKKYVFSLRMNMLRLSAGSRKRVRVYCLAGAANSRSTCPQQ